MNIFCDLHHDGLARSMFYLFGDRLDHSIKFPGKDMAAQSDDFWAPMFPSQWQKKMGGIPAKTWKGNGGAVSLEEFMDTDWDMWLLTRLESLSILDRLDHPKKAKVALMAQAGNEHTPYDWGRIRLLLSSDEDTFRMAPVGVERILTGQELGRHFSTGYKPIEGPEMRVVNTFINNIRGQACSNTWHPNTAENGACVHCGGPVCHQEHTNLWDLWRETGETLGGYTFNAYGHSNDGLFGGINVTDKDLPGYYASGALTWHVKGFDGWGHSLLQSIACGRPVIVERRFYRYRTAGNYLIPGVTCFLTDYDVTSCQSTIIHATETLEMCQRYSERCRKAAEGLFDWEHEAWRVQTWLDKHL